MDRWSRIPGEWRSDFFASDRGRVKQGDTVLPQKTIPRRGSTGGYNTVYLPRHGGHGVHRLVWSAFNGPIPDGLEIDHEDRIRNNNNLENIRVGTRSQNQANRPRQTNNTTGFAGIGRKHNRNLYRARVKCQGVTYEKCYPTIAECERWRLIKKRDLFGEFIPNEDKARIRELGL